MKTKSQYQCQNCGATQSKWSGQCGDCESWNTLVETIVTPSASPSPRFQSYSGQHAEVTSLADVVPEEETRMSSGIAELDRVLGGGTVPGSVVLIGGDPGDRQVNPAIAESWPRLRDARDRTVVREW